MSRPEAVPPGTEGGASAPAQPAKAGLRRLALERQEPTPENYARAYQAERGGGPAGASAAADAADGAAWAALFERTVRGLERGSRQWTTARKKDSLQRVLGGSRSDARRLQQRIGQLVASWDNDSPDEPPATDFPALDEPAPVAPHRLACDPAEHLGQLVASRVELLQRLADELELFVERGLSVQLVTGNRGPVFLGSRNALLGLGNPGWIVTAELSGQVIDRRAARQVPGLADSGQARRTATVAGRSGLGAEEEQVLRQALRRLGRLAASPRSLMRSWASRRDGTRLL